MSKRQWTFRLDDILSSIESVKRFVDGLSADDFEDNEMLQKAVAMDILIIGEAARHLPKDIQEKYHQIPWAEMIGMRHKITHDYYQIDTDILWAVVSDKLDELKSQIEKVKADVS